MSKFLEFMFAFVIVFVIIIISFTLVDALVEYDSTDDIENGERSGLVLYTDHETGCQYLEAGMIGGMTPRLNGKGEHMGCKD